MKYSREELTPSKTVFRDRFTHAIGHGQLNELAQHQTTACKGSPSSLWCLFDVNSLPFLSLNRPVSFETENDQYEQQCRLVRRIRLCTNKT